MRNTYFFALLVVAACSSADQQSLTGRRHSVDPSDPAAADSNESSSSSADEPDGGGAPATGDAPSGGTSSSGGTHTDAGVDASAKDGGTNDCINAVASPGSGHHHAGADCASCHDGLGASLRWTVAGTLYSTATGGTAISGATIEVVDANGKTLKLATYDNGNFYTTSAVAKPLKVRASKCPNDAKMVATVSDGSCNGCHNSAMRIHLP